MELHVLVCPQGLSSCRKEPQMRIEEETGCKLVGRGREGLGPPVLPHSSLPVFYLCGCLFPWFTSFCTMSCYVELRQCCALAPTNARCSKDMSQSHR